MMPYRSILSACLVLLLTAVLGCETGVDPLIGEQRPFTVWGLVDAGADTQNVRVFPISNEPGLDRPDEIDATVTSTDLTSGESLEWMHKVVSYEDGTTGHVYWAPFRAEHGHRYRIDVARSDGATSSATVAVPDSIDVTIERSETNPRVFAYVRGDDLNLLNVEMRYEATNQPPANVWPVGDRIPSTTFLSVDVPYTSRGERLADGWRFDIDMTEDFEFVRDAYRANCLITAGNPAIALRRVEFHFIAADTAWQAPGGAFDPNVLVEPGAMSNVKNGYGFVGAGRVVAERWTPTQIVRQTIGFETSQGCLTASPTDPACIDPPVPCLGEAPDDLWDLYF